MQHRTGDTHPDRQPKTSPPDPGGILLSVCVSCRDGRELGPDSERGGARFARTIAAGLATRREDLPPVSLRGVACMSQCNRTCVVALTAPGRFTYLFGDLDPDCHADAVLDVLVPYAAGTEGFMERTSRPEPLRAGILGRIPPADSASTLIRPLEPTFPETSR